MHSQFIPIDRRNEGAIVGNAVKVFRDGFVTDAPDGASWYEKWLNSAGTRVFPTIDPVTRGGNAAGSAYLRITLDPYNENSEYILTSKEKFSFPMYPIFGLSVSQRIVGQEVFVGFVGESDPDQLAPNEELVDYTTAAADIAISGTVAITTNVATINTTAPHGLNGGDRVAIYGCTENRLNVGPAVVTVVTDKQFTIPCTLANGTYTAGGYIHFAEPARGAKNYAGILLENTTATNGSFVSRRNGAKFRSLNQTIITTVATQSNTSPYTDAFNAAGQIHMDAKASEIICSFRASDSVAVAGSAARYSQGIPDEELSHRLQIRARNLPNFSKIVGNITAISKAGSTTTTVTTDRAHGLVTGQFVQLYGMRDQTNFANLATAGAVTVVDATNFTVVHGSAVTASSAGGVVCINNGSVTLPGATALAVQSIACTSGILTVTMNTTAAGALPGEMWYLAGCDGATASPYNGMYKILRMTGSTFELDATGKGDVVSTNCGGAMVKCTDVRLHFVGMIDATRHVVELAQANGLSDGAHTIPIRAVDGTITSVGTVTTVTTVATVTKASLDAQAVADIASAAITSTATSAAVVMTNIQSCSFGVAVTAVSGTTPTMDIVVQETIDGTNWYDIYHFERITASGNWSSPLIPIKGQSVRYVRTIAGTTPSFTMSLTREQRAVSAPLFRRVIDRTVAPNTLNSTTPAMLSEGILTASLVVNMGAITTTAPQFILEGSEDGTTFFEIGTALTAVASASVQLAVSNILAKYIRAKVKVAGSGATLGYVAIKVLGN